MSSKNLGRIKQIKQKQNGVFPSAGVPIGTDGLLVDMLSQLDLEEELKLGGSHYAKVTQQGNMTLIKEWFCSQSKGNTSIQNIDQSIVTHTCVTLIEEKKLGSPVYLTDQNDNKIVTQNNDYIITGQIAEEKRWTEIHMTLYKGLYDSNNPSQNILHSKHITITEDNGETIINQDLY